MTPVVPLGLSTLMNPDTRRGHYFATAPENKTGAFYIGTLGPTIFIVIALSNGQACACRRTLEDARRVMRSLQQRNEL